MNMWKELSTIDYAISNAFLIFLRNSSRIFLGEHIIRTLECFDAFSRRFSREVLKLRTSSEYVCHFSPKFTKRILVSRLGNLNIFPISWIFINSCWYWYPVSSGWCCCWYDPPSCSTPGSGRRSRSQHDQCIKKSHGAIGFPLCIMFKVFKI